MNTDSDPWNDSRAQQSSQQTSTNGFDNDFTVISQERELELPDSDKYLESLGL